MKPISARLLALALTALEGERYGRIHAAEYIACAGNQSSNYPNLQQAITLNQRIASWVQSCMVRSEKRKTWSEMSGYFVETAKVNLCQIYMTGMVADRALFENRNVESPAISRRCMPF